MAGKPPPIHYTWNVEKCFEFAKSWLEHYHVKPSAVDKVFAGTSTFVKKYSKKPPSRMTSKDVEAETKVDAAQLREKIETKLRDIEEPKLTEKRIEKILGELPDAEDLRDIMLSYRIHNTEDRIRIRKPTDLAVKMSDLNNSTRKNM
jgi:hypothetical protein